MKDRLEQSQFVDTNIFLYAYDLSDPVKQRRAVSLLQSLWNSGLGIVSIQVLQELYVNLTSKVPIPLSLEQASNIVADLGQWRHHVPGLDCIFEAVNIQQRYQVSFWDSMVICSALKMKCSILWTEDLNHGQEYYGVKVLNPFAAEETDENKK